MLLVMVFKKKHQHKDLIVLKNWNLKLLVKISWAKKIIGDEFLNAREYKKIDLEGRRTELGNMQQLILLVFQKI